MKILLNNREEEFAEETLNIDRLLEIKKFSFRMRIVKVNGNLIPKEEYSTTIIHDGDSIQMLYLMSGG
ncbi:MAG: sulfur carrier protein ThiS [Bacteroidales bacterium]